MVLFAAWRKGYGKCFSIPILPPLARKNACVVVGAITGKGLNTMDFMP